MGCASSFRRNSNIGDYEREERRFSILGRRSGGGAPLHLSTTKLTFTADQLACLNHYFNEQLDNRDNDVDLPRQTGDDLHSLVERLVQRLLCTVGTLDPRFASMLLINATPVSGYSTQREEAEEEEEGERVEVEPREEEGDGRPVCVVCEGDGGGGGAPPQGFARIRLQGVGCDRWAEFVNNNGYLRRDKVQERFVELLAQAVARGGGGKGLCAAPGEIDESRLAGAPGKVMPDALVAQQVLRTPANQRCYYGPACSQRGHFPDPRDFRIAIVEGGGPSVRMRVALLQHNQLFNSCQSADRDVSVTLTLGIEAEGWPRSADFPFPRTSITHCDALLYQRAATTGFYMVPCAPHPSTRCDDRSSTWQLRFPVAERLLTIKSPSTASRTLATLAAIVGEMRATTVGGCRTASNHLLATLVWFAREEAATPSTPLQGMRTWHRSQLSLHVLKCLDQVIGALQTQRQRSLHSVSLSPAAVLHSGDSEQQTRIQVTSELRRRWSRLLADMRPGSASEAAYSPRQLAYVRLLMRGMLAVKSLTLNQTQHMPSWYATQADQPSQSSEDVVYLLAAILEQARCTNRRTTKRRRKWPLSRRRANRRTADTSAANSTAYQSAVHCLLQQVRDDDRCQPDNDDVTLVREVLRWLYLAAEFDTKHIAPVVRPFLSQLFAVSHQNCWQQSASSCDLWLRNMEPEAHALGRFAALVNSAGLKPRDGVIDALGKGWDWAAALVETASRMQDGVELIFTPQEGSTVRHRLTVLNYTRSLGRRRNLLSTVTLPRRARQVDESLSLHESLAGRFSEVEGEEVAGVGDQWQTPHSYLRANSPMTRVAMATANQRSSYATTIVNALILLNKFTVLQEIASLLPEDERSRALDDIRRMTRQRRRNRTAATLTAHAHSQQSSFSSQHSGKTSASDRSLVRIDSIRINNWQQQNRAQSCLNMTLTPTDNDNNGYATYRSLDELSTTTADRQLKATADRSPDNQLIGDNSLLGTCRLARSRQSVTASNVCDMSFFDAPLAFWTADATKLNPSRQPLLALTVDNRLTLLRQSQQCRHKCDGDKPPTTRARKEMVTKL
ncbi:hypothetical protein LSTR_LSTR015475 [Laodelphax striatellus]|uniref:Mab-21-like nucleotidyltransferase domain-containing protein n=1 Tax=Laodelphax striatellus TaxID=195883 RepID=A0A482XRE9_LAOST|nr:hypothetical protein LSTR_LSTR015475 [Laodelphax striatellus]